MSDLISRQAAIDALGERPPVWTGSDYELGQRNQYDLDRLHLELVPSAQSEPKTGKWVTVHGYCTPGGDPVWACSECGKGVHVYGIEHGTYGADVSDGQWKACPNCGAMMKEGEEHENC